MRFEKIKDIAGNEFEVNLDEIGVITENDYNDMQICVSGYFINVDKEECERIRGMLEQNNVLSEVSKTEDTITKFKEIIYRATYLDSNAKLQLIMQLDSFEK